MSAHSYCTDKLWTTKLQRIQNRSAADHKAVFSNLGHILSEQMLTDIFHSQQGTKAVGVDGITKGEYGKDLASNCAGLLKAIRSQRRSIDWKRFDVVLKRLNFPKFPPIFRLYDFQRRSI